MARGWQNSGICAGTDEGTVMVACAEEIDKIACRNTVA